MESRPSHGCSTRLVEKRHWSAILAAYMIKLLKFVRIPIRHPISSLLSHIRSPAIYTPSALLSPSNAEFNPKIPQNNILH